MGIIGESAHYFPIWDLFGIKFLRTRMVVATPIHSLIFFMYSLLQNNLIQGILTKVRRLTDRHDITNILLKTA